MTKEELKEYLWIKENIRYLEDKILEINTQLEKITPNYSGDLVSMSKSPDKFGELIDKKIEIENRLKSQLDKSYKELTKIEVIISELEEREKYLMRLRYIEGDKWEKICCKMNYEWRHIHRLHSKILKDLKIK